MSDNQIILAPLMPDDMQVLFEWINDRNQTLYNSPYKPVHYAQHKAWFENIQKRTDLSFFTIRKQLTSQIIGTCQLHSINYVSRSAELQIRIGNIDERDKGYGNQAIRLLVDFGFNDLNLNRIFLHVFATNTRAIRVYENAGLIREGLLRKAVYLDGNYVDVVIMAILKDDYAMS